MAPSSRFLIKRLLRCLQPEKTRSVLEFGPGPGVATAPLLAVLPRDCRYVAVEKNPDFVAALRRLNDSRLTVLEADARQVGAQLDKLGLTAADVILASIPFSYLTKKERQAFVDLAFERLAPDGDFIVFHQYTPLMYPYLKKRFAAVRVQFEPLNFLPCFLFHCRK